MNYGYGKPLRAAGFLATALLLLLLLATAMEVSDAALAVGDTICAEGFVMDFFCINRGTLLDNPSVRTLVDPGRHSVHCLVDVNSCVTSPFEILLDPKEEGELFQRGWQLDEDSKQRAIAMAQSVGTCTTCDLENTPLNAHEFGFRMAMTATIVDLNEDDSIPPTISVQDVQDTTAFVSENGESACSVFFGVRDVLEDEESAGSLLESIANSDEQASSGVSLRTIHFLHGSLMMASWGFLLPSGTLLAKFYKHRPDGLWFKLHRGIQMLGLLLAVIGWIIALVNFNVFLDVGFRNYQHGICGMVVMILGILQPLNALIRPHAPESEAEAKSTKRVVWEIWHKSSGWMAVGLAIPTIVLGTLSLPSLDDQKSFQMGYGIACGCGLLGLVAYIFYDKKTYEQQQASKKQSKDSASSEDPSSGSDNRSA